MNQDMEQIDPDDLEVFDLKWQIVMLTMRARRFLKKTGRQLKYHGQTQYGFDKSKIECYNCNRKGHLVRECRAPKKRQDFKNGENSRKVAVEDPKNNIALVFFDGLGDYDWSDQAEEGPNFALMAYASSSSSSHSKVSNDSACS